MFNFHNPCDISARGDNSILDGISTNILNSLELKDLIKDALNNNKQFLIDYINNPPYPSTLFVLEYIVKSLGRSLDELTISDEHELLDYINRHF